MSERQAQPGRPPATAEASAHARPALLLQRTCACGGSCEQCREDEPLLHRSPAGARAPTAARDQVITASLATAGDPLAPGVRHEMESAFGHSLGSFAIAPAPAGKLQARYRIGPPGDAAEHAAERMAGQVSSTASPRTPGAVRQGVGVDFSGVRIHTDAAAAQAARATDARAFTVGQHVVFAPGQYAPESPAGRGLLAHELTHVVQQGQAGSAGSSAVVRRAPWQACPPQGQNISKSAIHPFIYGAAELAAVSYYREKRPSNCLISNKMLADRELLTAASGCSEAERETYHEILDFFHRDRRPRTRRDVRPGGGATRSAESGGAGTVAATVLEQTLLQPDILDLTTREVYDVTTKKMARLKVGKLLNIYVARLNAQTTGVNFKVGTSLPGPGPGMVPAGSGNYVCYQSTDFARTPGVIQYEAFGPTKQKKKKKQEKKKQEKKKEKKKERKKESKKTKESKKKKETEKKKEKPGAPGGNWTFGIGIGSTGGGKGNAAVGVSIMSSGQTYGTVSAGVVYDSHGNAIGTVSAGASAESSSDTALSATAGAQHRSSGMGAANVAAGAGAEQEGINVATATAGSSRGGSGINIAKVGKASGEHEGEESEGEGIEGAPGAQHAGTGAHGRGGTVGEGVEGPQGPEEQGGTGGPGQGKVAGEGKGEGTGEGKGEGAGEGVGGAKGEGKGEGGGQSVAGGKPGQAPAIKLPGLTEAQSRTVIQDAARIDAAVRNANPHQIELLQTIAQAGEEGRVNVPAAEWVELMLASTDGLVTDHTHVEKLVAQHWVPAEKADKAALRKSVERALKAKPPASPDATTEPVKKAAQIKAPRAKKGKQTKGDEPTPTSNDKKEKKRETREERAAHIRELQKRAATFDWSQSPHGAIIHHANRNVYDKSFAAQIYLIVENNGTTFHITADVQGRFTHEHGHTMFVVEAAGPVVAAEPDQDGDPIATDGSGAAGERFPLEP
jgi:outer membrane biosynthesis protein TonB